MPPIRLIVAGSYLFNLGIVGSIVAGAPGIRSEVASQAGPLWIRWAMVVALPALLASIPWFYAFSRATSKNGESGALAIALVSLVAWAVVLPAIDGPSEALGMYLALYLLVIWGTFAIALFRGK